MEGKKKMKGLHTVKRCLYMISNLANLVFALGIYIGRL